MLCLHLGILFLSLGLAVSADAGSKVCHDPDTAAVRGTGTSVLQTQSSVHFSLTPARREATSNEEHQAKVVAIVAVHPPKFHYLMEFLKQWRGCRAGLAAMDFMPMFSNAKDLQEFADTAALEFGSARLDGWHPRIAQPVPDGTRPQSWKKLDGLAQLLDSPAASRYEFAMLIDSEIGLGNCASFGGLLQRLRTRHAQRTWYGDRTTWPWDDGKLNMVSIPFIQNLSAKAVARDSTEEQTLSAATQNFTVFSWWNDLPFVHLGVARKMFRFWGGLLAERPQIAALSAAQVSANMGFVSGIPQLQNAGMAFEHTVYQYFCVLHEGFTIVDLTARLSQHKGISLGERFWELPEPDQQVFLTTVGPGWLRVRPDCALPPTHLREPSQTEGVLLYFHMDRCGRSYDGSGTWDHGKPEANAVQTVANKVPSTQRISDDELFAIKGLVQESWCAVPHAEQTQYSMIWHQVLPHANLALKGALPKDSAAWNTATQGDAYMFGVAQGDGMPMVHGLFPGRHLLGFDSFQGLPSEDQQQGKIPGWGQGMFQAGLGQSALVDRAGGPSIARVFPGFYNESLTSNLVTTAAMRPAFYVDIDCDLHVSAFAALDWLFANRIARVGTLIGYDDWWTIPCFKYHHHEKETLSPLLVGEGLAHVEVARKYGVLFKCVAGPCAPPPSVGPECHRNNNWGPVFVVAAVGEANGDHGFEFTTDQEHEWMANMKVCPTVG